MTNYANYIASLWNSNFTNMQNPCTPNFVTGIYENGTFRCGTVEQASESDPYWTANWTLFNQSWTNTFNQTVNDSINNYILSNNLSIQNYINWVNSTNTGSAYNDAWINHTFIPYTGATQNVNLSKNNFTVLNSTGLPVIFVNTNTSNVGIGGYPASSSYKLRVHGSLWADDLAQLKTLSGSSGVGVITYYDEGATFNFEVYGSHVSEAVKGIASLKSQDIAYESLANYILHADPNFLDNPSFVIRSRNSTSGSSYLMMNYHNDTGAYFVTNKSPGGDASIRFIQQNLTTLYLKEGGNVGIGTLDPLEKLHVNGNILANGTINATTDICIQGGVCLSSITEAIYNDAWITETFYNKTQFRHKLNKFKHNNNSNPE